VKYNQKKYQLFSGFFRVGPQGYFQWFSVFSSVVFSVLLSVFISVSPVRAEEKTWNAGGDGVFWADDKNWFMQGEPTAQDDVMIDSKDVAVIAGETYHARSLSLGGKEGSQFTTNNFVYGTIAPQSGDDVAVENRSGGLMILKGSAGRVVLKGQYLDNEEKLTAEPRFMFRVK